MTRFHEENFDVFSEDPGSVEEIVQQLESKPEGVSEYQLIQALQQAGRFADLPRTDPMLTLFQKHFIVMHCLYRLQPRYAEKGMLLSISPLRIQLSAASESAAAGQRIAQSSGGLSAYYCDWANFTAATPDSVADLLNSFWRKYAAEDQSEESLQILGLDASADWVQVQAQYRRLAAAHHPDKGGDGEQFNRVREAYETLKARFKP